VSPDVTTTIDGTIDVTVIGTDSLLDSGLAIATGVTATDHTTADAKSVAVIHARMPFTTAPVIDGIAKPITGAAPATIRRGRATIDGAVAAAAAETATKAAIHDFGRTTDVAAAAETATKAAIHDFGRTTDVARPVGHRAEAAVLGRPSSHVGQPARAKEGPDRSTPLRRSAELGVVSAAAVSHSSAVPPFLCSLF
jgi:hypothetical protein